MINIVNEWIEQTIASFIDQRQSCVSLASDFSGFYSEQFLSKSYFVIVDHIPKPDFPELHQMGMGDFVKMPAAGITYKDTYFVLNKYAQDKDLHFHELVHVAQWDILGAEAFITRYIQEILDYSYNHAPLESMAYKLQDCFLNKEDAFDVYN